MLEDGPGQVISMEGASLGSVASDQPFGRLDSHFSSLVCSRMVGGAHPVDDPKLVAEGLHLPGGEPLGPLKLNTIEYRLAFLNSLLFNESRFKWMQK